MIVIGQGAEGRVSLFGILLVPFAPSFHLGQSFKVKIEFLSHLFEDCLLTVTHILLAYKLLPQFYCKELLIWCSSHAVDRKPYIKGVVQGHKCVKWALITLLTGDFHHDVGAH